MVALKTKVAELTKENEMLKTELTALKSNFRESQDGYQKDLEIRDKYSRKNNVIITGIPETNGEDVR